MFANEEEWVPHTVALETGAMEIDSMPRATMPRSESESDDEPDYDTGGHSQPNLW